MRNCILILCFVFISWLTKAEVVRINFEQASSLLSSEAKASVREYIDQQLSEDIDFKIKIHSHTSPEGTHALNDKLSEARAENLKQFLQREYGFADSLFVCQSSLVDWDYFARLVYLYDAPSAEQLAPLVLDGDIKAVKNLDDGQIYSYLYQYIYPQLRYSSIELVRPLQQIVYQNVNIVYLKSNKPERKPLFALKTNLLYTLLTFVNIELEFIVTPRLSIAAEFIFPWWRSRSSNMSVQMRNFNLAVKYWFTNRNKLQSLCGWNLGVVGGYGLYDFQLYNAKGTQGRFFDCSLSAGYAHSIARNLRLEYQLAFGFLSSKNHNYVDTKDTSEGDIKVVDWPWEQHTYNWFGPTRAKVSLVWMINRQVK